MASGSNLCKELTPWQHESEALTVTKLQDEWLSCDTLVMQQFPPKDDKVNVLFKNRKQHGLQAWLK
jgi:hypothetical protein